MEVPTSTTSWVKLFLECISLLKLVASQAVESEAPPLPKSASVQFLNPPERLVPGHLLQVLYHCEGNQVVHVDILASSLLKSAVPVFKKRWACTPGTSEKIRQVRLELPDRMVFREDPFIKRSILVFSVILRAWITDGSLALPEDASYAGGAARAFHHIQPVPPYSRPSKDHRRSLRWDQQLVWRLRKDRLPACPAEQEIGHLLTFVYASTGENFGITKKLSPYGDPVLESTRQRASTAPRCTFSIWLYLLQHCPDRFCGILYQLSLDNKYSSPTVLLTDTGNVHVQMLKASGQPEAFKSLFTFPLHEWCRLDLRIDGILANTTMVCGELERSTEYRFRESIFLEDTQGHFVLGGSTFVRGLAGFFGPTVYHRSRVRATSQLSAAEPRPGVTGTGQLFPFGAAGPAAAQPGEQNLESGLPEPINRLGLKSWFGKCRAFQEDCLERRELYQLEAKSQQPQKTCGTVYQDYSRKYGEVSPGPQSLLWDAPFPPRRATVSTLLRSLVVEKGDWQLKPERLGLELFRTFERKATGPQGFARLKRLLPLLLQAGCLGCSRANYLASVLFQTGFGLKMDPAKALRFLLIAAQADERLAELQLGHKHHLGVDGFPVDYELSYAYYANVAKQTMVDRLEPSKNQSYVENIRLTDEEALKVQTKENSHLFVWLRLQARQGESLAQQAVSRMLFWGQQGISSNPKAAVKVYEKGAMQLKDPVLMYDYGIVLLRGQGVDQDIPKALEFLKMAADKKFAPAINSLGWYYEKHERDYQKAVEYWEKADALGHAEAPFNLGILHSQGLVPGKPRDEFTAYQYYWKSASRNHIDGAVHLAAHWIKGIPGLVPRKPRSAVEWSKWASEQNGYLGAILRKSLNAYLQYEWQKTLLHYIQAAEAGFEVAQFNMAYLCEQDPEGLVSHHIQGDCVWKYYNLSVHSDRPPSYAQIKMGDLFYTAHPNRKRDVQAAVRMYTTAALQQDPQGLYSLGILVEDGVSLPFSTLKSLGINSSISANNFTLLMELYKRCRDHEKDASYMPCSLALLNVYLKYVWMFHSSIVKFSSAIAIAFLTALSVMTVLNRVQNAALNVQLSV
ncbi:protein sel-1 homolog 3-like [Rhinatrema bivittatum]|uniref:protein sel-1 homolog 3-like n=1 Tax=Rhinatrema bivittatum TaxID=194408 RepID=UPI00112E224F|nr:protein sel-1 homolog 3-like [Rhinatrema bivittatum]